MTSQSGLRQVNISLLLKEPRVVVFPAISAPGS